MILGLPSHPLVVHFAVVLLPLGALALVVLFLVPRLRGTYLLPATAVTLAGVIAAIVAKFTGESLAKLVGRPTWHENLGNVTVVVGGLLAVASVVWLVVDRRARVALENAKDADHVPVIGRIGTIAALTTLGLAIATTVFAILTGHAGTAAAWEPRLEQLSPAPSPSASPSPTPTVAPSPSAEPLPTVEPTPETSPTPDATPTA
nr:hypothetical protein [Actinomycetales bacterium]